MTLSSYENSGILKWLERRSYFVPSCPYIPLCQAWVSRYHGWLGTFNSNILLISLRFSDFQCLFLFEMLEFFEHVCILKHLIGSLNQLMLKSLDAVSQLRLIHLIGLSFCVVSLRVRLRRGCFFTRWLIFLRDFNNLLNILGFIFIISL